MPCYFESLLLKGKITNYTYICLKSNDCIPLAINEWNYELSNVFLDDLRVHDVLNVCFRNTNDCSFNWIQYRVLHRSLLVKYFLKKINTPSSDSCILCHEVFKTVQHVFVKCKKILTLWNASSASLYKKRSKRERGLIFVILFFVNTLKMGKQSFELCNFIHLTIYSFMPLMISLIQISLPDCATRFDY